MDQNKPLRAYLDAKHVPWNFNHAGFPVLDVTHANVDVAHMMKGQNKQSTYTHDCALKVAQVAAMWNQKRDSSPGDVYNGTCAISISAMNESFASFQ